jgi:hypothetical protein
MRRPTVQGAARRPHSNKFRHHEAATGRFGGQQNTPATHRSGRSRVQLVNLANIAAYVVARIVLVPLSGQASGEFQLKGLGIFLTQSGGTPGPPP